jgi:hypothetical protein
MTARSYCCGRAIVAGPNSRNGLSSGDWLTHVPALGELDCICCGQCARLARI